MTSTTGNNGRLGNQIIRNLAVSLLAKKHNLKVNYYNYDLIRKLGIELFIGTNTYTTIQSLTDDNYFTIYHSDHLNDNLCPNNNYFQTKEITRFLYDYLHTEEIKSNIIRMNPYKSKYKSNNDLFIHIRLTDAAHFNPGISYYTNAIQAIERFDNLYISTDQREHNMISELLHLYPSAQVIDFDEINTIQFASTCKHIILSHGSFSATIGYLAFYSNIYYPEYDQNKIWYGDMFSIDGWNQIKYCP